MMLLETTKAVEIQPSVTTCLGPTTTSLCHLVTLFYRLMNLVDLLQDLQEETAQGEHLREAARTLGTPSSQPMQMGGFLRTILSNQPHKWVVKGRLQSPERELAPNQFVPGALEATRHRTGQDVVEHCYLKSVIDAKQVTRTWRTLA